jgi:hypothetical protein
LRFDRPNAKPFTTTTLTQGQWAEAFTFQGMMASKKKRTFAL